MTLGSKTNNMKFNSNKFKYINFNCSGIETQRRYMGPEMNSIDLYESVNDLGVTLSANCEFKDHITNTVNKCSQLSGWILRTFKTRDKIPMITLYKSLFCPDLTIVHSCGAQQKQVTYYTLKRFKGSLQEHHKAILNIDISLLLNLSFLKKLENNVIYMI